MASSEPNVRPQRPVANCIRCGKDFPKLKGETVCPACRKAPDRGHLNPELTFRERQVITLVTQAKLNKEIAHELHLGEGSIKEYLYRIFRKLGLTNRTELAVWAVREEMKNPK